RWTAEDGSLAIRTRYPGPVSRTRRLRTEGPRPRCDNERSEEHTSELQSRFDLVCRLLLEKKNDLVDIVQMMKLVAMRIERRGAFEVEIGENASFLFREQFCGFTDI